MNTFKLFTAVFTLLCLSSCKMLCDKYYQVNNIKEEINIDKVEEDLTKSTNFNFTAQREVSEAQARIIQAKIHLKETEDLIAEMRKNKSRYAEHISNLKGIFAGHVSAIERHLVKTGKVLKDQIASLKDAEQKLKAETAKVKRLETERDALLVKNTNLNSDLKKAEVYKEKYYKLTKYKWIVWGLGVWILVKFLGGLGAWSPQGRIARALIG